MILNRTDLVSKVLSQILNISVLLVSMFQLQFSHKMDLSVNKPLYVTCQTDNY